MRRIRFTRSSGKLITILRRGRELKDWCELSGNLVIFRRRSTPLPNRVPEQREKDQRRIKVEVAPSLRDPGQIKAFTFHGMLYIRARRYWNNWAGYRFSYSGR